MSTIDHINGPAPPGFWAVIDFTKVEHHLPLTDLAVQQSLALGDGPVPMLLAVFISFCRSQKHARILPDISNKPRE
jgi:hypothetical protein